MWLKNNLTPGEFDFRYTNFSVIKLRGLSWRTLVNETGCETRSMDFTKKTCPKQRAWMLPNWPEKGHIGSPYTVTIFIHIYIYIGTLNMLSCFCCSLLITLRIHSIAFFFPLDTKDPQRCRGLRATRNFRGIQCGLHGENWNFNGETLGKSLAIVVDMYWQNWLGKLFPIFSLYTFSGSMIQAFCILQ